MLCSPGKSWFLAFMWMLFLICTHLNVEKQGIFHDNGAPRWQQPPPLEHLHPTTPQKQFRNDSRNATESPRFWPGLQTARSQYNKAFTGCPEQACFSETPLWNQQEANDPLLMSRCFFTHAHVSISCSCFSSTRGTCTTLGRWFQV